MNTLKTIFLSAGLFAALQTSEAFAQLASPVTPAFEGPATTAEFTGPGDVPAQIIPLSPKNGRVDGKPVGLIELDIYEKSDEPCAIRAEYAALDKTFANKVFNWESPDSGCLQHNASRRIGLDAYTAPNPDIENAYFISSVGTCTNGKNNDRRLLVKGLSGNATVIDANGENVATSTPLETQVQPNCKADKFTFSTCPSGQIAMGINVRALPIGNKMSITGLQLKCKAVTGRIARRDGFKGGGKGN